MTASLATSFNSTIDRANSSLVTILRAYFGIASRVLPDLARRHAERLFTAPPRYAGRRTPSVDAMRTTVEAGAHSLAVWQVGPATAPAVLLSHGWGGRGLQMESFVAPLVGSGYRVVWFDHPGHGESGRGAVALPDFVRAITALAATHGPFKAGIGHSLGAAALALAMRRGTPFERAVFVSPPASINEHAHKFARFLGITPAIREAMRLRLERRYGIPFAEIDRIDALGQLALPALFVHDEGDAQVPFDDSLRLSARMPGARLVRTYGLGHYRILHDHGVVGAVAAFVRGSDDDIPGELPRLPRPAPLY